MFISFYFFLFLQLVWIKMTFYQGFDSIEFWDSSRVIVKSKLSKIFRVVSWTSQNRKFLSSRVTVESENETIESSRSQVGQNKSIRVNSIKKQERHFNHLFIQYWIFFRLVEKREYHLAKCQEDASDIYSK